MEPNNIQKKINSNYFSNKKFHEDMAAYIKQRDWIWREINEINIQIQTISSKLNKEESKGD